MRKYKWYLLLDHGSRRSIKKWMSKYKSPKAVSREFYGSAFHFNTEASLIKMSKKKSNLK